MFGPDGSFIRNKYESEKWGQKKVRWKTGFMFLTPPAALARLVLMNVTG
jgi:hypothetical protein